MEATNVITSEKGEIIIDTKAAIISNVINTDLLDTTPNDVNNFDNAGHENSEEKCVAQNDIVQESVTDSDLSKVKTQFLKNDSSDIAAETEREEIVISGNEKDKNPEENSAKTTETLHDVNEYDPKNVHYEGDLAIYQDPSTGYQYEWNKEKEEWMLRNNTTYGFEDDTHTYTDADGIKFFWDKEKNAWFPKINDDFMAQYQMNYGFVNTTPEEPPKQPTKPIEQEKKQEQKGIKRKPTEPTWFELDEEQNTKVYVSNLPTDTTEEEFVDFMQKCGLVMRDPITQKMKIKLYTEPGTNFLKGDALCTYIKIESVNLALKLLDGATFKDKKVKVEKAKFQMKGEYDPKLKPKTKKKKEKQKLKKMQEKLFDWRPEKMKGERAKHEKVVIVKNVFDPNVFDEDVGLILEYQQDLREECSKCGEVRKVIIYDRHPEGVAQVNMKEPEEAEACVTLLNKRWFGKRQLSAEIWDGKTKYKIAETDSEISQRINKWDKYLEGEK